MNAYIALLRAVNVGGTGKLSMSALKDECTKAGLKNVSTYIASGNVVFASEMMPDQVKSLLDELLRSKFNLMKNEAIIRTPAEVEKVIADNPFSDAAEIRPNWLMVNYLVDNAEPEAVNLLQTSYKGPERWHLSGRHMYIDYKEGAANSRLNASLLMRALKTPFTSRNWNTTNKLLDMAGKLPL